MLESRDFREDVGKS